MTFKACSIEISISFYFIAVITILLIIFPNENIVACFLFCIVHEFGHIISAVILGKSPKKIKFGYFGVRITNSNRIVSAYKDFVIAASGPLANIIAAIVCHAMGLNELRGINIALAVFNLLPIPMLDGGRILSCFIDDERIVRKIGLIVSILFVLAGAFIATYTRKNFVPLIVSIYVLIGITTKP